MMRCVTALSVLQRRVLRLWRWGMETREIATQLGITLRRVGHVAQQLRGHGFEVPRHKVGKKPTGERRPCLRCRRTFRSAGKHNRICDPCKKTVDWNSFSYDTVDPRWW